MKPLDREILAIALPAIVSNITTPLLGLVDTAITGHLGADYLGAIAVGGSMVSMLYWLCGFLRMGSSGLTAQAYGAGQQRLLSVLLGRSLAVALLISLALIALSAPLADVVLRFMDAEGPTSALARRYFMLVIWGAPAAIGTYALTGWFIGMQDSRSAMWMALTTNVSNIALSLWLVLGMGLRIEGVAAGTVAAQWLGLLLGLAIVVRKHCPVRVGLAEITDRRGLGAFFRINADIFLRTACLVAVTLWFTHAGAMQGTAILGANSILMQLFLLFSYFIDGFAYAGEALSGKYLGSGMGAQVRRTARRLMAIGAILSAICSAIYFIGGEWIIRLLTDSPEVRLQAFDYRMWAVLVPLAGFGAFVMDGIFVGLTMTRRMLAAMAAAMAVFFILYHLLTPSMGNHALWLAFVAYLLIRGLLQTILFHHHLKK